MRKERVGYFLSCVLFIFGMTILANLCYLCYYMVGFHGLFILAWGSIFGAVLVGLCTERCPVCHKYLGVMFFDGKKEFCPYCGCKFQDEWPKK